MPQIRFTQNIQRHVPCPAEQVAGSTVADALNAYFTHRPAARSYVLDEQGAVRKHMLVFVNGRQIADRQRLTDSLPSDATIDVMQALSGG